MANMSFSSLISLFSCFILLLVSSMIPILSEGLKITLVPPNSPESPAYLGNVTMSKKIQKLISQSRGRAHVLNMRAFPTKDSSQISPYGESKEIQPSVNVTDIGSLSGYVYSAKIGIGTFDEEPRYKTYYLSLGTGSVLTWLQCEECQNSGNTCFHQLDPLFSKSLSHSFDYLYQDDAMCDQPEPHNPNPFKSCHYNVKYADGARSYGQMGSEMFTFENDSPMSTFKARLVFGCGTNQTGFTVNLGEPKTAGVLSLGRGKQALHVQLDYNKQVGLRFSYCFQDFLNQAAGVPQPTTYLRFEEDIPGDPSTFQQTPFQAASPRSSLYFVRLNGIGVNNTPIPMHPIHRVILDSGSSMTHLVNPVFEALADTLADWFSSRLNSPRILQPDGISGDDAPKICFSKRPNQGYKILPTIHFLLDGGADLEIKPEQGFAVWNDSEGSDEYFCLMIEPHEKLSVIGAFQMVNQRFIYDTRVNQLLFKAEDCAINP